MIHIAEATDQAVRLALARCWLVAVAARRPPHDAASPEAGSVASELVRTLQVLDLLRGTRRDLRGLQRRAVVLAGRLTALGLTPPA